MRILLIATLTIVLVIILAQIYLQRVWFYRDPHREPEARENVVIAPADGQVIYIKQVKDGRIISNKLGQNIDVEEISKTENTMDKGRLVGIYMSPLDVHYNYSPVDGVIESIKHTQAKVNLPMVDLWEYIRLTFLRRAVNLFGNKYHFINERNTLLIKGQITVAMVEIADKFVNKIKCFVKAGDKVALGQKLSFIERGSQVDLFIPDNCRVKVKIGQQVYGGKTVLASYSAPVMRGVPPMTWEGTTKQSTKQ